MRRSLVWPLSLLLAVATGAAAGQTLDLASSPVLETDRSRGAATAAVRAFYDAANAVIRTGDAALLDGAVAADFIDHAGPPGVTPDRAGLGRYLVALHGVAPTARLAAEDVLAAGDRAMARVTVAGAEPAAFLGLALRGGVTVWGDADAFRVAGGRVAERWCGPAPSVGFTPLGLGSLGA